MHFALPGSALVHAAVLGVGLLLFAGPEAEDAPAAQSVSVEVIAIASVSTNQASTIESDATETLVSSGAQALPPSVPETINAVAPETQQPTESDPVETATAVLVPPEQVTAMAEPDRDTFAVLSAVVPELRETVPVAPAKPTPAPAEPPEAVQPIQSAMVQPSEIIDLKAAPVPHVLSRPRPSEPTQRPRRPVDKAPQQQAQPRPQAPAGNGGQNQADSAAAKPSGGQQGNVGSGGDADVARYPSQVQAKMRRALRSGNGPAGEVVVRFTVLANGQVADTAILQSSGNAALDQAALATVKRASPFPPIPTQANRSNWTFDIPLAFGG